MRVFVYDDTCGPCTRAAAFLARRTAAARELRVLPFSRVRAELTEEARERFSREALFLQGTAPEAAWGHAAVARALLCSPHRVDRLAGRVILARPVAPVARCVYGWVSRHRRVLDPLFPPACPPSAG